MERVATLLPFAVREEIGRLRHCVRDLDRGLEEIRLRAGGLCTLTVSGRDVPLSVSVSDAQLHAAMQRLCGGSVYAYRDTLTAGYIPWEGGVRVGVCAQAHYEGGTLVGIGQVSALVIRLPHPAPPVGVLAGAFARYTRAGMLLFSPPGGGKTTVLRALVRALASGPDARRTVVADERREFLPGEYTRAAVDLLCGYKKEDAIAIALHTLSPRLLAVDEIGGQEQARAMAQSLCAGVPLLATVHAATPEEVLARPNLVPILTLGVFDTLVGIHRQGRRLWYDFYRLTQQGVTLLDTRSEAEDGAPPGREKDALYRDSVDFCDSPVA